MIYIRYGGKIWEVTKVKGGYLLKHPVPEHLASETAFKKWEESLRKT